MPELAAAIVASPARRLVTLNLAAGQRDRRACRLPITWPRCAGTCPELQVDVVLADGNAVGDPEPVRRAAESLGARLVLAPVAVADGSRQT